MTRRIWKHVSPCSLRQSLELNLEHAKEKKNFSVDRVADQMGLSNKWSLYKWMENGRMPAILVHPFEVACGIDLPTRYQAHSSNKLLVPIPSGRKATSKQIHELQSSFATAVNLLVSFYENNDGFEDTQAALTALMEDVAWHHKNIEKNNQPDLCLEF